MKILGLIIILALLVGCAEVSVEQQEASVSDGNDAQVEASEEPSMDESTESSASYEVLVSESAFLPDVLNVKVGDSITWVAIDPFAHHLVSDNFAVDLTEAFTETFDEAGMYVVRDTEHGQHSIVMVK